MIPVGAIYKEVYNQDIVSIDDAKANAAVELTLPISPVQDLHGQDVPYPAGGGKNKFDPVNYETIDLTGDSSAIRYGHEFPPGTYTIVNSYTASIYYRLPLTDLSNRGTSILVPKGTTATVTVDSSHLLWVFVSTAEWNTAASSICVNEGNDTAFHPWENLCPISGWDSANITGTGKNLFDKNAVTANKYIASNGTITDNSSWEISDYIPVNANGTISYNGLTSVGNAPYSAFYDKNKNFISSFKQATGENTQSVPANAYYVRFSINILGDDNTFIVATGSTASEYEPYTGETHPITFPSTVYGGNVKVNKDGSRKLVADMAIVDMGTLNWSYNGTRFDAYLAGLSLEEKRLKGICSIYPVANTTVANAPDKSVIFSDQAAIVYVKDSSYSTDETFKTAVTGQKLVYELATPVEIDLTELEVIETLKGVNNVWASTGEISYLKYQVDDSVYWDAIKAGNRTHMRMSFTGQNVVLEDDDIYLSTGVNVHDILNGDTDLVFGKAVSKQVTTAILNKKDIVRTIDTPKSVMTFDAVEAPMDITTEIKPVQDLNGYESPWPGGGGKNKCPYMQKGVDAGTIQTTFNADGSVLVNGTNGSGAKAIAYTDVVTVYAGTEYVLTGCPANGSLSSYRIDVRSANDYSALDTEITGYDYGNGFTFTPTTTHEVRFAIRVAGNYGANNLTFYPMLRLSSVTDATYAPYSNICPISGWTGADITGTGKNLFDYNTCENKGIDAQGVIGTNANRLLSAIFNVKKGQTYTVSYPSGIKYIGHIEYTDGDVFVTRVLVDQTTGETQINPATNRIRLYFSNVNQSTAISKSDIATVQLEAGSSASAYEAYQGETYSITFPDTAGTVYGATLTVNEDGTGKLVVDREEKDLGSLSWTYASTNDYFRASLTQGKGTEANNIICSAFEYAGICGINSSMATAKNGTIWKRFDNGLSSNATHIYIKWTDYTDATQFKTAVTGQKLVYELATPVTYNFTAQQIKSLLGENNIWTDTGDVESVTYYEHYNKLNNLKWTGEFTLEFGVEMGSPLETNWVTIGTFSGEKPNNITTAQIIDFTAYDRMTRFEVLANEFLKTLTYPKTVKQIYDAVCSYVGVQNVAGNELASIMNRSYTDAPADMTGYTCRDILAWIAEACGCYAKINSAGKVQMVWFTDNTSYEVTPAEEFGIESIDATDGMTWDEADTYTWDEFDTFIWDDVCGYGETYRIDQIMIKQLDNDMDINYPYASGNNVYIISDNPFLSVGTYSDITNYIVPLYNRMYNFGGYRPAQIECVGNWCVEAGDVITVDINGETIALPVFVKEMKWNSAINDTYEATGNKNRAVYTSDASRQQVLTSKRIEMFVSEATDDMMNYTDGEVANALNTVDRNYYKIRSGISIIPDGVTISGGKYVKIQSGSSFQVESGGNIDIHGTGTLELNGSTVQIKSGSTFDVESTNLKIASNTGIMEILGGGLKVKRNVTGTNYMYNLYLGNTFGSGYDQEQLRAGFVASWIQNTINGQTVRTYPIVLHIDDFISTPGVQWQTTVDFGRRLFTKDIHLGSSTPEQQILSGIYVETVNRETASVLTSAIEAHLGIFRNIDVGQVDAGKVVTYGLEYQFISQTSSKDIKHNIQPLSSLSEKIDRLKPVTFVYDNDKDEKTRMGLIYEDTVEVMPEICTNDESNKAISYVELIPALLKEIQELRARVKTLEEREEN